MKNTKPLYILSNITKKYPSEKNAALDIEELVIPKNALVAVIGYSGSGKTTLLNLLGLLDRPDQLPDQLSGQKSEIQYFDENDQPHNLSQIKDSNTFRRQNFGFIFQEGYLLGNLSGGANIEIPMHINGFEIDKSKINELLEMVGINDNEELRLPSGISGGESQKIAFVRSIVHDPKVILADEPTSSLDHDIGLQLINFLKGLCKRGKSVIWITHNIHQAVALADYIIVLKNGKAHGPIPNPKNHDEVLKYLRQDENIEFANQKFSHEKPESAKTPLLNLFKFLINFAWSDIFPKADKKNKTLFFGRRNTQWLNMISLFLVICLSMLLLNISYAFKNYFILSVSDPLINKIIVQEKVRGSQKLTQKDIEELSNLVWAREKGIASKPLVVWPEKIETQKLIKIRKATMGAFGIYRGSIDCFMNPDSKGMTMSGIVGISMAAVNINDPILKKMQLINNSGEKKPINTVFVDENKKIKQDKEGVVISRGALEKILDYKNPPDYLEIDHYKAENKKLPILGVAEGLPYNVDIIVTEGWYIQQYLRNGKNDPIPAYYHISIYVHDKIEDGLPVCHALEDMGYTGIGETKNKLYWIRNMTDVIFMFIFLVILIIGILAFSFLGVSYASAMKSKKKEMGILMAKGITKPKLYFVFCFEILMVWLMSMLSAFPTHSILLGVIKKIIAVKFEKQQLNIQGIFEMPDCLWPVVIFTSLSLAFISVLFGIRGVLKNNLASILRSGD